MVIENFDLDALPELIENFTREQVALIEDERKDAPIPTRTLAMATAKAIDVYRYGEGGKRNLEVHNATVRLLHKIGLSNDSLRYSRLTSALEGLLFAILTQNALTFEQFEVLVRPFKSIFPEVSSPGTWTPEPPPTKEGWLKARRESYGTPSSVGVVQSGKTTSKPAAGSTARRRPIPAERTVDPEAEEDLSLAEIVRRALAERTQLGLDLDEAKKEPEEVPVATSAEEQMLRALGLGTSKEEPVVEEEEVKVMPGGNPDKGVTIRKVFPNGWYSIYERDLDVIVGDDVNTFRWATPTEASAYALKQGWRIMDLAHGRPKDGVYVREFMVGFSLWDRDSKRVLVKSFESSLEAEMEAIDRDWPVLDETVEKPDKPFTGRVAPIETPMNPEEAAEFNRVIAVVQEAQTKADELQTSVEVAQEVIVNYLAGEQTDITDFAEEQPSSSLELLIQSEGVELFRGMAEDKREGDFVDDWQIITKQTKKVILQGFDSAVDAMMECTKRGWSL